MVILLIIKLCDDDVDDDVGGYVGGGVIITVIVNAVDCGITILKNVLFNPPILCLVLPGDR